MVNIKFLGLKKLSKEDTADLQWVLEFYKPKFDRKIGQGLLTVSVKGSHMMGRVGRFTINLLMDSPKSRLHTEQTGWGLIKTTRRACEHMQTMLDKKLGKEMLDHKPRKLKKKR